MKFKNHFLLLMLIVLLHSCSHQIKKRTLSESEIQKFNLVGEINEARICPTSFDEKSQSSVVVGPCELVTCEFQKQKLNCTTVPENRSLR